MPSPQQRAKLRCCASCEWIYRATEQKSDCPRCGFASYGARWVHGPRCYRFERTQEPWSDRQLAKRSTELYNEILEHSPAAKEYYRRQMVRGHSLSLND